mgnify:CR=1 FL=1
MSDLFRYAFQELDAQCRRLPSDPVGLVAFVFDEHGVGAPVLVCEDSALQMTIARFIETAAHLLADLARAQAVPIEPPPAEQQSGMLSAERACAAFIERLQDASRR